MNSTGRLDAALEECVLHAEVLREALAELGSRQFDASSVSGLGKDQRRLLDQMAYRFGKLQDTLGEKVLPDLLDLAEEPLPPSVTFAEKLQRLERLNIVESAATWREMRELRNQIAHEYHDQPEVRAAILNRFVSGVAQMLSVWRHISAHSGRLSGVTTP